MQVVRDQEGGGLGVAPEVAAAAGPIQTQIDIWAGGQAGDSGHDDYEFSQLIKMKQKEGKAKNRWALIGLSLLVPAAFLGLEYYESQETGRPFLDGMLDEPLAFVSELIGLETQTVDLAPPPSRSRVQYDDEVVGFSEDEVADVADETNGSVVEGNPYWALPNTLEGKELKMNRQWTAAEEEIWRAGMNHRFQWQRHKTILQVREQRLRGSEAILFEGLRSKKLWTRMHSLVALAEFGKDPGIGAVEEAIANEPSERIADFFERFVKKSSAGARVVMRHAVKVMDEKGRLVALRALDRANDSLRDLYLAAATMDPGPQINRWVQFAFQRRPVDDRKWRHALAVVSGKSGWGDPIVAESNEAPGTAGDAGPYQRASSATGEYDDYDEVFDEDLGDVEFYESDESDQIDYDQTDDSY